MKASVIKAITAMAIAMAMVFTSVGFAEESKAKATESTKAPSYLFVLQAEKGTLKSLGKDGLFKLTLKHTDVNNVIEFSDRPYRMVKYITADQLKNSWNKGTNSFESDPPNAVLMAKGHKAQIIVLKGMTVTNDNVSFQVHLTSYSIGSLENGNLENISLLTDGDIASRAHYTLGGSKESGQTGDRWLPGIGLPHRGDRAMPHE